MTERSNGAPVEKAERLRLFVAVSIPRDRLAHVAATVASVKYRFPGARWTDPESQHVTLAFIGWTDAVRAAAVGEACALVSSGHSPAEIALGDLGAFPSRTRVRVLWVGLRDDEGLLAGLAADFARALRPLGVEPEKRAFTPHLTLARMKTPQRPAGGFPALGFDPMPWRCDELTLFRSHLSPRGARYEELSRYGLTG